MAASGETGYGSEGDWEWVGASPTTSVPEASPAQSKSARKNQNRQKKKKQQRQQQQQQQQLQPAGAAIFDGVTYSVAEEGPISAKEDMHDFFPGLETALKLSAEAVEVQDRETLKSRIKHCRKLLRAIEDLSSRPKDSLDRDQQAKINRRPAIEQELATLEAEISSAESAAANAAAAARAEADRARELVRQSLRVAFDDEFACPICHEVLEAAMAAVPCNHVFCRSCLETAVARAADASHGDPTAVVCPLCRACLYDAVSGKVRAEPARGTRKRMGKTEGTCHCGQVCSLTQLRSHLRGCGEVGALFGEAKKFGHEFQQPFLDPQLCKAFAGKGYGKKKKAGQGATQGAANRSGQSMPHQSARLAPATPPDYNEEEEIQAALIMSLQEAQEANASADGGTGDRHGQAREAAITAASSTSDGSK